MSKTQTTIRVDEEVLNQETKQAIYELETRDGKSFKNIDELFDDLDN